MHYIKSSEYNLYNSYNLQAQFKDFLRNLNKSKSTLKNYLSDIRHFFSWITARSNSPILKALKPELIRTYRAELNNENLPHKTINRRLSTIRLFCTYCVSKGLIKENPSIAITNIKASEKQNIENQPQFKDYLLGRSKSKSTIKNYLSDIRYFTSWARTNNKISYSVGPISDSKLADIITLELINLYRTSLLDSNLPHKTINRRLSTIRIFCTYCVSQAWLTENPCATISNIKTESKLRTENTSKKISIQIEKKMNEFFLELDSINSEKTISTDVGDFITYVKNETEHK